MDEDLKRAVKSWSPPEPSADFDDAMMARFRSRRSWISRWLRAKVAVPVPVLAVSLLALIAAAAFVWQRSRVPEAPGWQPVAEPKLRVIRAEVQP